jgi:hypothetical protein
MGRWRVAGVAAIMAALLAACGSPDYHGKKVATLRTEGKPATATPARSDEDRMHDFQKCMEEHGVRFPKSEEEARDFHPDEGAMQEANEACVPLLPNGGQPPKLDAKQLDELRQQAKCMREHGVDMPDPDPNNPYPAMKAPLDEETMRKATDACFGGGPSGAPEPTK